jgi:hypothetical protein
MMTERPSCDEYMRMPISEEVIEHIRSCETCRTMVNVLSDHADRRAYEFDHRN